jgi:hypothetical protein
MMQADLSLATQMWSARMFSRAILYAPFPRVKIKAWRGFHDIFGLRGAPNGSLRCFMLGSILSSTIRRHR